MTPDESCRGNQFATKRWRITLIPLLTSIALHGLLAILTLSVSLPLTPPPDSPGSLAIRLVASTAPAPDTGDTRADTPVVRPESSGPPTEEPVPPPPGSGQPDAAAPAEAIVLQPLPAPGTSPQASGDSAAVTGPDVLAIRESIQGLARSEGERLALEDCTETQRRSELFRCEEDTGIPDEVVSGALLPEDFMAEPAAIRVEDDRDLPFTERDPADRVLDNLRSGDPAYELMKRIMGRR